MNRSPQPSPPLRPPELPPPFPPVKVSLLDEQGKHMDSAHVLRSALVVGEELELDRFLVQIEGIQGQSSLPAPPTTSTTTTTVSSATKKKSAVRRGMGLAKKPPITALKSGSSAVKRPASVEDIVDVSSRGEPPPIALASPRREDPTIVSSTTMLASVIRSEAPPVAQSSSNVSAGIRSSKPPPWRSALLTHG